MPVHDAEREHEPAEAPSGDDQSRNTERQPNHETPGEDRPDVSPGFGERGLDLRLLAGLGDRETEHRVEIEGGRGDRDDGEQQRDEQRAAHDVELPTAEHVALQIHHRQPDPHGRQHLDQGQLPVGDEQPDSLEEHREGTHDQGQRSEEAIALAEGEDGVLDLAVVPLSDRLDQSAEERSDASPTGRRNLPVRRSAGTVPRIAGTFGRRTTLRTGRTWQSPIRHHLPGYTIASEDFGAQRRQLRCGDAQGAPRPSRTAGRPGPRRNGRGAPADTLSVCLLSSSSRCATCGGSTRPTARCCGGSTSPSTPAPRSASSAATARGSPRCCGSWPARTTASPARPG